MKPQMKLEHEVSFRWLLLFALPTIFSSIFANLYTTVDGIFVARNYGERIAVRGGKAGSLDRAGLNALHFYNPRTYDGSATIGFRSAFIE